LNAFVKRIISLSDIGKDPSGYDDEDPPRVNILLSSTDFVWISVSFN